MRTVIYATEFRRSNGGRDASSCNAAGYGRRDRPRAGGDPLAGRGTGLVGRLSQLARKCLARPPIARMGVAPSRMAPASLLAPLPVRVLGRTIRSGSITTDGASFLPSPPAHGGRGSKNEPASDPI